VRCHTSVAYAMTLCRCVRLYVCLSVTYQSAIKAAKRRIMQTTPATLVFSCKRS